MHTVHTTANVKVEESINWTFMFDLIFYQSHAVKMFFFLEKLIISLFLQAILYIFSISYIPVNVCDLV